MQHTTSSTSRTDRRFGTHRRARVVLALLAALASVVLAACGGDDSGGAGGTSSGAGTAGSVNSAQAKQFRELLGLTDKDLANLKGKSFKVGSILPLSGGGANFAVDEGNGVKLAVDQMRNYLGMDVTYTAKDHKSGDPQAGAAAARQLGIDGYGAVVNSYVGVFGSTLKSLDQYKMLSFDPGGGTNTLKGKPYFWGFRSNSPNDAFPALAYVKEKRPEAKRVALVVWDAGAAFLDPINGLLKKQLAANGMTYAGTVPAKIGATDYSAVLSKVESMNPDVVWLAVWGADPGYFMKQYVGAGLDAQVIGSEYTPTGAKIAGSAYDDYWFAADFFPVDNPPNPLSKFFLKEYQRKFGELPGTFYQPNYYEATLAFVQLAARVAAKGGDINSGEQLNQALEADPTFKSVYGGDDTTVGTIKLDPKTHDPIVRPVGLFETKPEIKQLAQWNIDGADFKTVAP